MLSKQGPTVPAVREESEEVVMDCSKIIESKCKGNALGGKVSLIRINPKHAEIHVTGSDSTQMIPIFSKAEVALKEIDRWIELLQ